MSKQVFTDKFLSKYGYTVQYNADDVANNQFKDFMCDENAKLFVDSDFINGKTKYTDVVAFYNQEEFCVCWEFSAYDVTVGELINGIVNWKYDDCGCSETFYDSPSEEQQVEILNQGHLWVEVSFNNKLYSLSYNHGIDATVIFEIIKAQPLKYINYFHGGFNLATGKYDSYFLENARTFIKD